MANEKRLIDAVELADRVFTITIYATGMRNGKTLVKEILEKYRNEVLRTICKAPTVDAVEVVHAYWKGDEPGDWHCSHCGECAADGGYEQTNYCPNCGAKMYKNENP